MPSLIAYVEYAEAIHGWDPTGMALVSLTQDNPILDAHRQVLLQECPRRAFETQLHVTVGGLRADKGTYYAGRERVQGLAKLSALQEARKLGLVNGQHLISKTFDRDDHRRDESTFVSVEARFTRPNVAYPANAMASVNATGPFGERHLDVLVDALWQTFQRLVDVGPASSAYAYWQDQRDDYRKPADGGARVAAFMLLDSATLLTLGGAQSAAERLGAIAWKTVRGSESNGAIVQLGRRPEDTAGGNLRRIRAQLDG